MQALPVLDLLQVGGHDGLHGQADGLDVSREIAPHVHHGQAQEVKALLQ